MVKRLAIPCWNSGRCGKLLLVVVASCRQESKQTRGDQPGRQPRQLGGQQHVAGLCLVGSWGCCGFLSAWLCQSMCFVGGVD